jgi:site-specific DNA-cytosine methylase
MPKNKVNQVNPNKESGGKQPFQQNRIYDTEGLAPALCANKSDLLIKGLIKGESEYFEPNNPNNKKGLILAGNMRGGKWENIHESGRRVYNAEGKAPTIPTMQGGNQHPKTIVFPADYRSDEGIRIRENGKAPTLTRGAESSGTQYNSLAVIGQRIRRLTPLECERLQTVTDNYTNQVSDSQRYKMLGNGWTIDVIAHIFSHLKNDL